MKKIVVETVEITRLKEKLHFQINIPENAVKLIGIDVTSNLHNINAGGITRRTHRSIGILRLHIADRDDCFFSQMLHADYGIPLHERVGNLTPTGTHWVGNFKPYEPFPVQELSEGTLIYGYYEDLVGYIKGTPTVYKLTLTFHYQVRKS